MLEIGQPDDPRESVRGPAVVPGREPLDRGHAQAARGEVVRGGAPHRAEADDEDVSGLGQSAAPGDAPRRSRKLARMAHSGRDRHRDIDPGRRRFDDEEPPSPHRTFRITEAERQSIAEQLRYIDASRRALEDQQNAANREIVRELRASADRIYDVLNDLEEIG
jgi:hypothetical protein